MARRFCLLFLVPVGLLLNPIEAIAIARVRHRPDGSANGFAKCQGSNSSNQSVAPVDSCNLMKLNLNTWRPAPRIDNKLAVYIYNFGSFDAVRSYDIPCVPPGIDAFFFIDDLKVSGLYFWRRRGWKVVEVPLENATEYISAPRITSKSFKFNPPSWLIDGQYEWVVSYDTDNYINLEGLPQFLENYTAYPLVMLDWEHWRDGDHHGFDDFLHESNSMLEGRPGYISTSRDNCIAWQRHMVELHQDKSRNFTMSTYFDSSIIFRHVNHPGYHLHVKKAFSDVFAESHRIQRDQFLIPYFLWKEGVTDTMGIVRISELKTELGHCNSQDHEKRNL